MEKNLILIDPAKEAISAAIYKALCKVDKPESSIIPSPKELYTIIEKPPEAKMGDYAFPCFSFAKILRKNPNLIANSLKDLIDKENKDSWLSSCKVLGAFLNFHTDKAYLAEHVFSKILEKSLAKEFRENQNNFETSIMIEFSQPNTHKEFHVGHGRNVCLGDSISRLLKHVGYKVTPVNYIGDEGTHVAKCLWQIKKKNENPPKENYVRWCGKKYVEANEILNEANATDKEKFTKEISSILNNLEKKSGDDYQLWQETRKHCLTDFNRIYDWLDISFDHFFYESELTEDSQKIVDEYIKKGLFKESDGAYGIDMDSDKLGYFMVRKSDGTSLYITKDLALARKKFEQYNISKSIYVVGSEQELHFKQLFKALNLMGFKQAKDCYHLSYGHVVRPEGKMSSRKGNSFTFNDLMDILLEKIQQRLDKYKETWSEEKLKDTAHKLAVGSIKYGMLSTDPQRQIIFDPDAWTSFEGNSGPYLMYSYARSQSILEKGHWSHENDLDKLGLYINDPVEHELLRYFYDLNEVILQASKVYKPSFLAHHLYNMCKTFNKFYAHIPILKAGEKKEKTARLALVKTFSVCLHHGLNLLGITPPEKM